VAELVYPPVLVFARGVFRSLGLKFTLHGAENIPREGGAVLAINHVSYLDFIFAGMGAQPSGRLVRFMAKEAVFRHRISGPLMRGMKHIPVDRDAGSNSYREALKALRAGEVIGVFPEATISRSFTVKDIKNGASRMAAATGSPLIPMALWGGQRLWTKGHPKHLTTRHVPVLVYVGEPMYPQRRDDPVAGAAALVVLIYQRKPRRAHGIPMPEAAETILEVLRGVARDLRATPPASVDHAVSTTIPAPIVRPPSRRVKRTPGSIATGLSSTTRASVRAPGAISPSSSRVPVTSVPPKKNWGR
jgi:1-acyl-sn-glycerol-3-phosphate acyltransferase